MFTGLIEEIGEIKSLQKGRVNHLEVSCESIWKTVVIGDSVAIDGACLTVTAVTPGLLSFSFVRETAVRTTLIDMKIGDKVNMETSLKAGEALGGHFVLGHVDGMCAISSIRNIGESREIEFSASQDILRFIVEKGSVAIDGISLTIAGCSNSSFKIALIPHSLENTTLKYKKAGDIVNVETDILGKYVYKLFSGNRDNDSDMLDLLKENGFM